MRGREEPAGDKRREGCSYFQMHQREAGENKRRWLRSSTSPCTKSSLPLLEKRSENNFDPPLPIAGTTLSPGR